MAVPSTELFSHHHFNGFITKHQVTFWNLCNPFEKPDVHGSNHLIATTYDFLTSHWCAGRLSPCCNITPKTYFQWLLYCPLQNSCLLEYCSLSYACFVRFFVSCCMTLHWPFKIYVHFATSPMLFSINYLLSKKFWCQVFPAVVSTHFLTSAKDTKKHPPWK